MDEIEKQLKKIKAFVFDIDGVLSPSTVPVGEDGVPCRMVNIKDGYAMQLAVKRGYYIAIISGGHSQSIKARYNALGIRDVFMSTSQKLPILNKLMFDHVFEPDEVIYVGDDIPDHDCMKRVGFPVAPADAAPEIIELARYVSTCNGGYGVARDIIERVMKARGDWMTCEAAFGW